MEYQYITENNLENRQKYSYSDISEEMYIAYLGSRENIIKDVKVEEIDNKNYFEKELFKYYSKDDEKIDVVILKKEILKLLLEEKNDKKLIDQIVKTFEVRKRLYNIYYVNFKPIDEGNYFDIYLYMYFSYLMLINYQKTKNYKYLNSLLKANDILISLRKYIVDESLVKMFYYILSEEITIIKKI